MGRFLFIQDNAVNENIGVMSIAGVLKQGGHDVDLLLTDEHPKNYLDLIAQWDPDLIGFSFMTGNRKWAYETARSIKRAINKKIIFGGVHPTFYPEDISFNYVDYICIGEGEYPVLELMEAIDNGKDDSAIKNLWIKKQDGIIKNPLRNLICDLDSLPLPYREIYYKYTFIRDLPMKRFITGIGCPYKCTFCHNPLHQKLYRGKGKFVRKKSIGRVIQEIENVKNNHFLKRVHFSDDLFILDKAWLKSFLALYRERIDLPFSCNLRIDQVDEDMIRDMKQSKCIGIMFGIESGSEKIRNKILKKKLKQEIIIRNALLIKKYGIRIAVCSLFGLPEETLADAMMTLEINQAIKPFCTRPNILLPYPKTEIAEYAIKHQLLDQDFNIVTFDQDIGKTKIKSDDMKKLINLSALFYLWVRFPFLKPLFTRLLRFPFPRALSLFGFIEGFESMLYHQIFNIKGLRYAFHVLKNATRNVYH